LSTLIQCSRGFRRFLTLIHHEASLAHFSRANA
jgi:hypothetical protein